MTRDGTTSEVLEPSASVQTGDRLRLTFSAGGVFAFAKRFLIEQRLKAQQGFRIEQIDYTPTELVATVVVVENPLPVALIAGAFIAAAASTFVFLSLVKVERIIQSPAGALAVGGIGAILAALAIGIVVSTFRTRQA